MSEIGYLRDAESRDEPTRAWLQDAVTACLARALAIVDLMRGYEGHADRYLPGTLNNACWAAKQELLAAQEALDKQWRSRTHNA
jgi:hypothetical protein